MSRRLAITIAASALVLGFASPAFAGKAGSTGGKGGKPSGGGSSSLTLVMVNDANGNGLPNYADSIRFDVSTTTTTEPHVSVKCTQGGSTVYSSETGYYPSYPWPATQTFTLRSSAWTGGAASCTARLYSISSSGSTSTLATKNFAVDA